MEELTQWAAEFGNGEEENGLYAMIKGTSRKARVGAQPRVTLRCAVSFKQWQFGISAD